MNETLLDKSILVEDLLENLPAEWGEQERRLQQAALYLRDFVGKSDRPLSSQGKEIALHLARDTLFDLYQGFRLGMFRGVTGVRRAPVKPLASQIRLRERLEALTRTETARAEMFHWFLAGLRCEIGALLREQLRNALPTWDSRGLFTRWREQLALVLEQAFRIPGTGARTGQPVTLLARSETLPSGTPLH